MKKEEIITILKEKETAVEKIIPVVERKQRNRLKHYLLEIKDLIDVLTYYDNQDLFLVGKEILEKRIKTSDVSIIEEEGYYYKIVLIKTFPYPDLYMVNISSLDEVF